MFKKVRFGRINDYRKEVKIMKVGLKGVKVVEIVPKAVEHIDFFREMITYEIAHHEKKCQIDVDLVPKTKKSQILV